MVTQTDNPETGLHHLEASSYSPLQDTRHLQSNKRPRHLPPIRRDNSECTPPSLHPALLPRVPSSSSSSSSSPPLLPLPLGVRATPESGAGIWEAVIEKWEGGGGLATPPLSWWRRALIQKKRPHAIHLGRGVDLVDCSRISVIAHSHLQTPAQLRTRFNLNPPSLVQ
ncbi:unnamed protein product [Pleuronectes platessa]|uniref:Uncharacterized protein n=1 Tax=Pleuronectes platessa TaxID=8262 RepID=A0A9N7YV87_PLEPL|nr:unnamed protein product [Pleuronectes platessa]